MNGPTLQSAAEGIHRIGDVPPSSIAATSSAAHAIASVIDTPGRSGSPHHSHSRTPRGRENAGPSARGAGSPPSPPAPARVDPSIAAMERMMEKFMQMQHDTVRQATAAAIAAVTASYQSQSMQVGQAALQAAEAAAEAVITAHPAVNTESSAQAPMDVDPDNELKLTKLEPKTRAIIAKEMNDHKKRLKELRAFKAKVEALQENINKLDKGEVPNCCKPFKLPKKIPAEFESTFPDCLAEDYTIKVKFPKGSTFKEVKQKWHMENLAFEKAFDLVMLQERLKKLEQSSKYEYFEKRVIDVSKKQKDAVDKLGVDVPDNIFPDESALSKIEAQKLYRTVLKELSVAIEKDERHKTEVQARREKLAKEAGSLNPAQLEAARKWKKEAKDKDAFKTISKGVRFSKDVDYDGLASAGNAANPIDFVAQCPVVATDKRKWSKKQLAARKQRGSGEELSPGEAPGHSHKEQSASSVQLENKGKPKGKGKGKQSKGKAKGKGKGKACASTKGKSSGKAKGRGKPSPKAEPRRKGKGKGIGK